jgi:hypothetical protein
MIITHIHTISPVLLVDLTDTNRRHSLPLRGALNGREPDVLKKVVIAGSAAAVALLAVGGVAYADDNKTNCSSHETTKQKNKGNQLVGGNVIGRDINGFIGGSIDKPGFCPSAFNHNKIGH